MSKIFIIIGAFIVFYSLIAKFTGFPLITDFMPAVWFLDLPEGAKNYKIVPSNEPSYIWVYDIIIGILVLAFGLLLKTLK